MSVLTAPHSPAPARLRTAFAAVLRRLATSPLDNSVLQAMGAPRRPSRP
ncbi:hypothetical protein ACPC54_39960 [Kitasatospora sp. NPDC094028]